MIDTRCGSKTIESRIKSEIQAGESVKNQRRRRSVPFAYAVGYRFQFADCAAREQLIIERLAPTVSWPEFKRVQSLYYQIASVLSFQNAEATVSTPFERAIIAEIRRNTKLQYKSAMWIGDRNVDLFFSMIAGDGAWPWRHLGLAIEVNGSVHDRLGKMKKDSSKEEMLHQLGIGVLNIDNGDVRHPLVVQAIQGLKTLPRLDSRGRARVMMRVYLETIICNASDEQLSELFGFDFKRLQKNYENAIRGDSHEIQR